MPFPMTFDAAVFEGGGYTSRDGMWPGYVNRDVLAIFEGAERLGRADLVDRFVRITSARFDYRFTAENAGAWGDAGNIVHWGMRLGLLAEAPGENGERGWRITDREPRWVIEGTGYQRVLRQVRGLPPEEQEAQYRREETARRRRETLDRKARAAADERIAGYVARILEIDPDHRVPEGWARRGWVPTWLPGTLLSSAAAVVRDAHHAAAMDRRALKAWSLALDTEALVTGCRVLRRARRAAAAPETVEIPDADMDALEAVR